MSVVRARFTAPERRRLHSDSCRQAAYRARLGIKAAVSEPKAQRVGIVYERPRCEGRYIGIRRYSECNTPALASERAEPVPFATGPLPVATSMADERHATRCQGSLLHP